MVFKYWKTDIIEEQLLREEKKMRWTLLLPQVAV